jgi:hypothetical protein
MNLRKMQRRSWIAAVAVIAVLAAAYGSSASKAGGPRRRPGDPESGHCPVLRRRPVPRNRLSGLDHAGGWPDRLPAGRSPPCPELSSAPGFLGSTQFRDGRYNARGAVFTSTFGGPATW